MNDDAQEAALGLLGLTNNSAVPLIPQKRKHPSSSSSASASNSAVPPPPPPLSLPHPPTLSHPHPHPPPSLHPLPPPTPDADDDDDTGSADSIRCICGYTYDDGWSVACDRCGRWYHGACVEIEPGAVPHFWICPEHAQERDPLVDQARKERAQAIQKQYQRKTALAAEHNNNNNNSNNNHQHSKSLKRRPSPTSISDKKQRRISSNELKKRRRSISKPVPPLLATQPPQPAAASASAAPATTDEDEHIEIDVEDTYIPIAQDAVSLKETREKLSRNAQNWRGVTVLDVPTDDDREIYVKPTAQSSISPSFALHTSAPVRKNEFIAPYTSTIVPSSVYLSDPLNAYAHLGVPKPFVHIIGPPHNIALDSRVRGNRSRFARSGCNPNSVLRPYLCGDQISFGIFALRDLKEDEEVVLGWEWDDGNAIHHLPAVLEHPELFTQEQKQYLRFQLANLLHSLGSTFATCACGNDSKQCALKRVNDFVDGVNPEGSRKVHMGPLVGAKRGFQTKERVPRSSGMYGVEMVNNNSNPTRPNFNNHHSNSISSPEESSSSSRKDWGSAGVAMDGDADMDTGAPSHAEELKFIGIDLQHTRTSSSSPAVLAQVPDIKGKSRAVNDGPMMEREDCLPHRMRKQWNKQRRETMMNAPTPESEETEPDPIQIDSPPRPPPPPRAQQQHPPRSPLQPRQLEPKPPPLPGPMPAPVTPARQQPIILPPIQSHPPAPLPLHSPHPQKNHHSQNPSSSSSSSTFHFHPPLPQTPLSLPPQTQAAVSSLLTLSNQPPAPSPSAQFANLSLYSPAFLGRVPAGGSVRESPPSISATRTTTHEGHVRFATSPPVIHPISSPPPPSSHDFDMDTEMNSKTEIADTPASPSPPPSSPPLPPAPSLSSPPPQDPPELLSNAVSSEVEPPEPTSANSASRSQSPNLSPRFGNASLSPSTTPSPLQSSVSVPAKELNKKEEVEKEKEAEPREHTEPPPSSSPLIAPETPLPVTEVTTETAMTKMNGILDGQDERDHQQQDAGMLNGQHEVDSAAEKDEKRAQSQPAPQPKVKMSLKDFSMMRKKQREAAAVEPTVPPTPSSEDTPKVNNNNNNHIVEKQQSVAKPASRFKREPSPTPPPRMRRPDADAQAEVLKQAHINRSTLSFGSFGIDDDFIMNSEDSKLEEEGSAAVSSRVPPPRVYEKPMDIIPDTPQSPSPSSSPLSISAHLPTPSPQPESVEPVAPVLAAPSPRPVIPGPPEREVEQIERKESQEEEGEITAAPDPAPVLHEDHSANPIHIPALSLSPGLLPAKNPPTQPRSFSISSPPATATTMMTSASISPPPHLPSRARPPAPPLPPSLPLPNRPPPLTRPPSGPRAFRQSFGNGIAPPRGPLADRDRDRERDSWDRERERGVSSWSSRGRGRGSWVR